jgi:hypothetical protein
MKRIVLFIVVFASTASAQEFPPDDEWRELFCGAEVMTDLLRDEANAQNERDLVGDVNAATGWRASDGEFLYLRMRLDDDPAPDGTLQNFAWGFLIDTDNNVAKYEVLLLVDGVGEKLSAFTNTEVELINDPADPPDEPAVLSYELGVNVRSIVAAGSSFDNDDDFFLDIAIPWQDLAQVDLTPNTPIVVWAATSSTATQLNGDLACFDDSLNNGEGDLDDSGSSRTVLDPNVDTDGDGFTDNTELQNGSDPRDLASRPPGEPDANFLAGGGGCAGYPLPSALLLFIFLGRSARARSRLRGASRSL